jgi:hypothetical protein
MNDHVYKQIELTGSSNQRRRRDPERDYQGIGDPPQFALVSGR